VQAGTGVFIKVFSILDIKIGSAATHRAELAQLVERAADRIG
jgi:hypothetical protein